MVQKLLFLALCLSLFSVLPLVVVLAEAKVGVVNGNWVEYKTAYTGSPPESYLTGVKMEVQNVQGKNITIKITVKYSDGTQDTASYTLDIDAGKLGDGFIVPANLNKGDTFYEENEGEITIHGVEERTYAGATRTVVVYTSISQTDFYWDKTTGVLLEANQPFNDYTLNIKADRTNIWESQTVGPESTMVYILIIVAIALVATGLFIFIRRK